MIEILAALIVAGSVSWALVLAVQNRTLKRKLAATDETVRLRMVERDAAIEKHIDYKRRVQDDLEAIAKRAGLPC